MWVRYCPLLKGRLDTVIIFDNLLQHFYMTKNDYLLYILVHVVAFRNHEFISTKHQMMTVSLWRNHSLTFRMENILVHLF